MRKSHSTECTIKLYTSWSETTSVPVSCCVYDLFAFHSRKAILKSPLRGNNHYQLLLLPTVHLHGDDNQSQRGMVTVIHQVALVLVSKLHVALKPTPYIEIAFNYS